MLIIATPKANLCNAHWRDSVASTDVHSRENGRTVGETDAGTSKKLSERAHAEDADVAMGLCKGLQPAVAHSRRAFLGNATATAFLGVSSGAVARSVQAEIGLDPDVALERLMAGNDRFVRNKLTSFQEDLDILRRGTVEKQEPFAAILACADSRVPVELVFDQSLGRLFVTRVAGNVATTEVMASLEYGAVVLGIRAIMVLGHQGCGAVKAAAEGKPVPGQISALYRLMRPAVEQGGSDLEAVARTNARIQADLLATSSPVLADLIKRRELKIVAAHYALATGRVAILG